MSINKPTNENLESYLENYGLKEKVSFGSELSISEGKIILPESYKHTNPEESLGMIFLVLGISEENLGDLENYTNKLLSENELQQLKSLYIFLNTYKKSSESFFNSTQKYIEKSLDNLSQSIIKKSSLWTFIKEKLELKNITSFENLVEEYIDFTKSFLENRDSDRDSERDSETSSEGHGSEGQDGEGVEENDDYYENNGLDQHEQMKGEDNGVFAKIEPYILSKYFSEHSYNSFNHKTGKFTKGNKEKQKLENIGNQKTTHNYFFTGEKGKKYSLPIDKYNISISNWNSEEIEVFEDNYGSYSIKFLKNCETNIGLYLHTKDFVETSETDSELIYTGSKIDISQFKTPQDIINYIQNTKKYKNISQKQFNTGNTNADTEKLFEAPECDCLPANKLFTILCRNLGFSSRFVVGTSAYSTKNTETKQTKTLLSTNKGHAWSEVYIDGKWQVFDATPIKQDQNQEENDDGDLLDQVEKVIEKAGKEQVWEGEKLDIKKARDKTVEEADWNLENTINNPHFNSAYNYVKQDAVDIVNHIKNLLEKREQEMQKRKLGAKKQIVKRNRRSGKLHINSNSIQNLSVGNPNIFSRKDKLSPSPEKDIDTRLQDISLAIDVSASMGGLTGNWENGQKADYAYLSMVLLYLVAKSLEINFENIVCFGDKPYTGTPENMLETFEVKHEGNNANSEGIENALSSIETSKKGVAIILSDGDGASGKAFFNEKSKNILKNNSNIVTLGYGLGDDASQKLSGNMKDGKVPTVIDVRIREANREKQSKGYPLLNYENLVIKLKEDLTKLMTMSKVVL